MKFGKLIEYNMRNIFFEKYHKQKVLVKLFSDPYLKYQNWAYLWWYKVLNSLFLLYANLRAIEI